jgi:acetyl-CoA carboxylase biotin carboxyl carrier protein
MSETDAAQAIARAAAELVPPLTERLKRLGLGEIEVRQGDLRVRVVADEAPISSSTPSTGVEVSVARPPGAEKADAAAALGGSNPGLDRISSPAVGYFVYADGLGPGLEVAPGTELGFVEMLGIRHEVRAVADGVVRHLVVESGEPVEYGQLLVEIGSAGAR